MLTNKSPKKHTALKTLCYALLAGLGMTQTALVVFAADNGPPSDAVPLVRINPEYPADALKQGMEGWVQLEFTITATGAVADPVVVDNGVSLEGEEPSAGGPDDMFNSSALAAIAKWRYTPKVDNGVAVERTGVQTIIRYVLNAPNPSLFQAVVDEAGAEANP